MERDELARVLHRTRFPLQPQHLNADVNVSGWIPFHRYLPLFFLGHVLAQALARLVAEVDLLKRLGVRLCWLHSLLGHDRCPLRREALVVEVNPMSQLSPHVRQPPFCPACVCSFLAGP